MEHNQALSSDISLKQKNEVQSNSDRISMLFIGSSGAGKTSLITKVYTDDFTGDTEPTISNSSYVIGATINGKDYEVQLVDTGGLERFESLMPTFYRSTDGAMIVYDITNYSSYERVKFWMMQAQKYKGKIKYPIILLGNKIDMDVDHIHGQNLAEDLGMEGFFKTSAKSGEGVKDTIKLMINLVLSSDYKLTKSQKENLAIKLSSDCQQSEPRRTYGCYSLC